MCNTRCSLGVLAEPLLEHDKEEPLKSSPGAISLCAIADARSES